MPFLPPNQQRQSTEALKEVFTYKMAAKISRQRYGTK